MTKVFIIGGSGRVARHLITQLKTKGYDGHALYRKPEQASELAELGAAPVLGDLTKLSVGQLSRLLADKDTVVFSAGAAGAGMEVTNAIDGYGLELSVEAAKLAGIQRFLLVSVFPDAMRDGDRNEGFENYIRVKKLADAYLVASGLEYAILRPGTLLTTPGTGLVRADKAIPYGSVSREDVAATLLGLIERPFLSRVIVELTQGDTPIADALDQLGTR